MMSTKSLVVALPALAAPVLLLLPGRWTGSVFNAGAALATFLAASHLFLDERSSNPYLIADDLNVLILLLNTFVALTTAVYSVTYVRHELEVGRFTPPVLRVYHALFQAMLAAMNLAVVANNIGLIWVGLELATLITIVMVGLYRTPAALEAAWKYFILGSVGISLAFLGTILVYLAGQPVLGEGEAAMTWSNLRAAASALDAGLVNLAFAFLLIGYGTKMGLVPLHFWLPDAHAEGPTPVTAILSGLLLNVAMLALLRFKMILDAHPTALRPGPILVAAGVVTLLFAVLMLYRRGDLKRLFAYSSVEHVGLTAIALGIGGPLASFAALFHVAMHSMTKSAIFFAVGRISQMAGTQRIADIRGLAASHPALGFGLGAGMLAIAGLPPFGVFASEFLILTTVFAAAPALALATGLALVVGFGALLLRLQDLLLGDPTLKATASSRSLLPLYLHLGLVATASIYLPPWAIAALKRAAEQLG